MIRPAAEVQVGRLSPQKRSAVSIPVSRPGANRLVKKEPSADRWMSREPGRDGSVRSVSRRLMVPRLRSCRRLPK